MFSCHQVYHDDEHVMRYEDDTAESEDRAASLTTSPLHVRGGNEGRREGGREGLTAFSKLNIPLCPATRTSCSL